jgi:hypothetical protein
MIEFLVRLNYLLLLLVLVIDGSFARRSPAQQSLRWTRCTSGSCSAALSYLGRCKAIQGSVCSHLSSSSQAFEVVRHRMGFAISCLTFENSNGAA